MAAVKLWENPPTVKEIGFVDAGVMVSVRIFPTTLGSVLGPDASGIGPHVQFFPTLAPDGTGAFQLYDPQTGLFGPEASERPTTIIDGMIVLGVAGAGGLEPVVFDVDVGSTFLCPWPGQLKIVGGSFGADPAAPYQIVVTKTMPQGVSWVRGLIDDHGPFVRQVIRATGQRPLERPTMTFAGVGAAPVAIPRGAAAVQINRQTLVAFNPAGIPGHAAIVQLNPGPPMPLGIFSIGSFNGSGGSVCELISFHLDIA